jgi:hypothetical protein
LLEREFFQEVGGFNEDLHAFEDWDLQIRLAREEDLPLVPWPPVAEIRVHPGNTDVTSMAESGVRMLVTHSRVNDPPPVKAAIWLAQARCLRSLSNQRRARRSLMKSFAQAPLTTIRLGGMRLFLGSLMPPSVARRRTRTFRRRGGLAP